jgi:hypothetical protein
MFVILTSFCYNIEQLFYIVKREYFDQSLASIRKFVLLYQQNFICSFHGGEIVNSGQSLVIQGAVLGSILLAAFGWIVSADAASLQFPESDNTKEGSTSAILPPMLEQLDNQVGDSDLVKSHEDLFEASIAYTPENITSPSHAQSFNPTINESEDCQVSQSYPQSILNWCKLITQYAHQNDLEPNLIAAVILQESGGQQLAYSHSGAVGLMQVMPRDGIAEKFMCKNGPCFSSRPTISELQDPEFNIAYGTRMLSGLKGRFGNIRDALKSYGPMDVGYSYADKVLAIFERYGN